MKQRTVNNACCLVVLGLVLCLSCCSCSTTSQTPSTPAPSASSTPAQAPVATAPAAAPVASRPGTVLAPYIPPPERMDLCGEPVPLTDPDVLERFDREFTLIVYNHAQVYLWLKRMERYFPWVEERLRYYNLPEDLKYVAIVESDLLPDACSPKGAAGPWQFMPSTGASYGLEQRGSLDRRFDFERATESAFRLLSDLNRRYKNWALAMAAYNCGDKRIVDEMRAQKVSDYYHLKLPLETERYVFRVLAVKAVLGNPTQYGYVLPKGMGYSELKLDKVTVSLSSPVSIRTVAEAGGITYRQFKGLNAAFRSDDIPAGTHELKFPAGAGQVFEQNFSSGKMRTASATAEQQVQTSEPLKAQSAPKAQPEPQAKIKQEPLKPQGKTKSSLPPVPIKKEKTHTVKKGDTLGGIAQHYKVGVQDIRKANKLKGDDLSLGQSLKIP